MNPDVKYLYRHFIHADHERILTQSTNVLGVTAGDRSIGINIIVVRTKPELDVYFLATTFYGRYFYLREPAALMYNQYTYQLYIRGIRLWYRLRSLLGWDQ